MGPVDLVRQVERSGFRLVLDGDRLRVHGDRPLPQELEAALRHQKDQVVAVLAGQPCDRCGESGCRTVLTYWSNWRQGLCADCVAIVAAEFDQREWPPVPWADGDRL